ncbi:MAG: UDP-N-acetylmuramoyl-tripeptide--D-alanyl-D-alanine ligase [Deltaproteobacteria bacterium]|nr:UDP-N-acetylmuramoyl-tripeptide--D-alanyl-D-alanine ligase [Deltaproteobacteria bacterium]
MGFRWGDVTARDILTPLGGSLVAGSPDTVFSGISTDSRKIPRGYLFWVLRGERHDAHDFVADALEKGAAGVVLEEPLKARIPEGSRPAVIKVPDTLKALGDLAGWWRQGHGIPVAAVTGSVGKTTTKEMAAAILQLGAPTLKNEGNLNNLIGLPLTLLSMEERHRRAVVEMGMNRAGEIARLTEIADPDIGLITNVAKAHLEGVGGEEGVLRAKTEMVEKISARSLVLLNGDDKRLLEASLPFGKRIKTFGTGRNCDFRGTGIRNLGREGIAFELHYEGKVLSLTLGVPGTQHVANALAACAIALSLGEEPENLVRGLESFRGIKGRFMLLPLPRGITLVDDTYNANPVSLKVALRTLKDLCRGEGRMIAGIGDMLELGDETPAAHREAGAVAAEVGIHHLLAIGDYAREVVQGALERGIAADRAEVVGSREEMASRIRTIVKDGDLVLLKGSRGMALERVVDLLRAALEKET